MITDIYEFLQVGAQVQNYLIGIVFALALYFVVWGIFKFVLHANDPEERAKGRAAILWSIIGVFLMMSIWGLINILLNSFALDRSLDKNDLPSIPLQQN
jgi:hypothetical protein